MDETGVRFGFGWDWGGLGNEGVVDQNGILGLVLGFRCAGAGCLDEMLRGKWVRVWGKED